MCAYLNYETLSGFSKVIKNEDILADKNTRLSVQLFVEDKESVGLRFGQALSDWENKASDLKVSVSKLFEALDKGNENA